MLFYSNEIRLASGKSHGFALIDSYAFILSFQTSDKLPFNFMVIYLYLDFLDASDT